MELGLQGKHAIVAGGSRGIGKAIALELAREGVDLAIVSRAMDQLEKLRRRSCSRETGDALSPWMADVTSGRRWTAWSPGRPSSWAGYTFW